MSKTWSFGESQGSRDELSSLKENNYQSDISSKPNTTHLSNLQLNSAWDDKLSQDQSTSYKPGNNITQSAENSQFGAADFARLQEMAFKRIQTEDCSSDSIILPNKTEEEIYMRPVIPATSTPYSFQQLSSELTGGMRYNNLIENDRKTIQELQNASPSSLNFSLLDQRSVFDNIDQQQITAQPNITDPIISVSPFYKGKSNINVQDYLNHTKNDFYPSVLNNGTNQYGYTASSSSNLGTSLQFPKQFEPTTHICQECSLLKQQIGFIQISLKESIEREESQKKINDQLMEAFQIARDESVEMSRRPLNVSYSVSTAAELLIIQHEKEIEQIRESMKSRLKSQENIVKELQKRCENVEEQKKKTEIELETISKQHSKIREDYDVAVEKIKEDAKQISNFKQEVDQLYERINSIITKSETIKEKALQEKQRTEAETLNLKEKISELTKQIADINNQNDSFSNSNSNQNNANEMNSGSGQNSDKQVYLFTRFGSVAVTQDSHESLKAKIDEYERVLAQFTGLEDSYENVIFENGKIINENKDLQQQISEINAENEEAQHQIYQLSLKIQKLETNHTNNEQEKIQTSSTSKFYAASQNNNNNSLNRQPPKQMSGSVALTQSSIDSSLEQFLKPPVGSGLKNSQCHIGSDRGHTPTRKIMIVSQSSRNVTPTGRNQSDQLSVSNQQLQQQFNEGENASDFSSNSRMSKRVGRLDSTETSHVFCQSKECQGLDEQIQDLQQLLLRKSSNEEVLRTEVRFIVEHLIQTLADQVVLDVREQEMKESMRSKSPQQRGFPNIEEEKIVRETNRILRLHITKLQTKAIQNHMIECYKILTSILDINETPDQQEELALSQQQSHFDLDYHRRIQTEQFNRANTPTGRSQNHPITTTTTLSLQNSSHSKLTTNSSHLILQQKKLIPRTTTKQPENPKLRSKSPLQTRESNITPKSTQSSTNKKHTLKYTSNFPVKQLKQHLYTE